MLLEANTTLGAYQRALMILRAQRDQLPLPARARVELQRMLRLTWEQMIGELHSRFGGNTVEHVIERAARRGVFVPQIDS
jgi:hypothetical protein